jgi:hypothetical protein
LENSWKKCRTNIVQLIWKLKSLYSSWRENLTDTDILEIWLLSAISSESHIVTLISLDHWDAKWFWFHSFYSW